MQECEFRNGSQVVLKLSQQQAATPRPQARAGVAGDGRAGRRRKAHGGITDTVGGGVRVWG